jgi:hypothetical protein
MRLMVMYMEETKNPGGMVSDPYTSPIVNIISDLLIERSRLLTILKKHGIDPKTGEKIAKILDGRLKRTPLKIKNITKRLKKELW